MGCETQPCATEVHSALSNRSSGEPKTIQTWCLNLRYDGGISFELADYQTITWRQVALPEREFSCYAQYHTP